MGFPGSGNYNAGNFFILQMVVVYILGMPPPFPNPQAMIRPGMMPGPMLGQQPVFIMVPAPHPTYSQYVEQYVCF